MNQRPHLSEIILNWKQLQTSTERWKAQIMEMHIKEKDLTVCSSVLLIKKNKKKTKTWQPQGVCLSLCFNLASCLLKVSQSLMQAWNFMERPLHQDNHFEGAVQCRQQGTEAAVVDKRTIIRRASRPDSGAPTSSQSQWNSYNTFIHHTT